MIVRVLGSAAGGGVPQWNCGCANCRAAREGSAPRRTQSSFAVSGDGEQWWLVNCSPDAAVQIEAFAPLRPHGRRDTPIAGMLLTDANVDHAGGLAVLRQSGDHGFAVCSSAVVRDVLVPQPAFAAFAKPPHVWLAVPLDGRPFDLDGGLEARAIPVPGTTPGFDGRRTLEGAVVAYDIGARGSAERALFAPVFSAMHASLRDAIARAGIAFLDGSFYTDDEMRDAGLSDKRASALGHQPVRETLAQLPQGRGRIVFAHLNNSNPMLDPASAASQAVRDAGAEIAFDGMAVELSA